MKGFCLAVIFTAWVAGTAFAKEANPSPLETFHKANEAYRGADFEQAASLYESLLSVGWKNASVYYNLGNAYFKLKRIGPAILSYERAKRISPRDRDIEANLAYTRGLLEYRVEDKRNWYLRTLDTLLDGLREEEIRLAALGLGLIFWISWSVPLYLRPGTTWAWKRKTLLVLMALSAGLWASKGAERTTRREAIVLKSQAAVRYGPSPKDQVAFKLGEGIKVVVRNRSGEWSRILLTNGETGWIFQGEIGIIS